MHSRDERTHTPTHTRANTHTHACIGAEHKTHYSSQVQAQSSQKECWKPFSVCTAFTKHMMEYWQIRGWSWEQLNAICVPVQILFFLLHFVSLFLRKFHRMEVGKKCCFSLARSSLRSTGKSPSKVHRWGKWKLLSGTRIHPFPDSDWDHRVLHVLHLWQHFLL